MSTYTATRTETGRKIVYALQRDGQTIVEITSEVTDYRFINVQGWDHTDKVAARLSRKPKPVGAKIEYGRCVASVEIT